MWYLPLMFCLSVLPSSTSLKKRWDKHMSDCRRGCGTTLASFVGELRDSGVNIDIFAHLEWAIKKHAKPFNPVSNQCFLCLYEKYFILWEPPWCKSEQKNRNIFSLQTQGVLASSQKLNLCTVSFYVFFFLFSNLK